MHHHMYKRFIFLFVSINHPIIFGNHKTTKTSKFRSHLNVGNKIHRTIRYIANMSIPIDHTRRPTSSTKRHHPFNTSQTSISSKRNMYLLLLPQKTSTFKIYMALQLYNTKQEIQVHLKKKKVFLYFVFYFYSFIICSRFFKCHENFKKKKQQDYFVLY